METLQRRMAVLLLATANAALAQQTHIVGPGGFATIHQAVQAAGVGDFIEVAPGVYSGLSLTQGVTIRATTPGTVTIANAFTSTIDVPPGQSVHLVGLELRTLTVIWRGTVTMDECTIVGSGDRFLVLNAKLFLQECDIIGNPLVIAATNATMIATNSFVSAIDSTFAGSPGTKGALTTHAVWLTDSTLHASSCEFRGGFGTTPRSAVLAEAASRVWISDSSLSNGPGVCPLEMVNSFGRMARCVLTPTCAPIPITPMLGVSRATPMTAGTPFSLTYRHEPGAPIGFAADWSVTARPHPLLSERQLLGSFTGIGFGIADSAGVAPATWTIPPSPSILNRSLWIQGAGGFTLPLRASPVAGGVVR